MNKQDWAKAQTVFQLALAAGARDRNRIIDRELGDQPELAQKVRKLLAEDAADSTFGGAEAAASVLNLIDKLPMDEVVGRYRIIKRIGEGGMGSVYLAERSDDTFDKQVALKLIRGDLSEQALERFSIERQALAQLEHPNIARLLDGGVDERSRPYVAMEYVDGLPITHHCDQQRLSIDDRIGLFIDLCDAIQHAHRNLIVHRDIKPSNVLVTNEGTVKLLDFGIAKLLGPGQQQALTATAARVLTPDYASPEQVTGGAITTATDVYQLGVLLYELLCGLRPLDTGQLTPSQFEAALLKGDITAPSRFTERLNENADQQKLIAKLRNLSAERLSQSLQGDLDTIVRKAMAPESSQRYTSPSELAADLARYIEGLPIQARPASLAYRTRKFIGRNKLGVSIAAGIVAMVIGFTGYLINQAEQIRVERDIAQRERDKATRERDFATRQTRRAQAIAEFLVDAFSQANPLQKRATEVSAEDIVLTAEQEALTRFADEPEISTDLFLIFGRIYQGLGDDESSLRYLESALAASRETVDPSDDIAVLLTMGDVASNARDWITLRRVTDELTESMKVLDPVDRIKTKLYGAYLAKSDGDGELSLSLRLEALNIAHKNLPPYSEITVKVESAVLSQYRMIADKEKVREYLDLFESKNAAKLTPAVELEVLDQIFKGRRTLGAPKDQLLDLRKQIVEKTRSLFGDNNLPYYIQLSSLAKDLRSNEQYEESLRLFRDVLDFYKREIPHREAAIGGFELSIALILDRNLDDPEQAASYYESAVVKMQSHGLKSPAYALSLFCLARFSFERENDLIRARDLAETAQAIFERSGVGGSDKALLDSLLNEIDSALQKEISK